MQGWTSEDRSGARVVPIPLRQAETAPSVDKGRWLRAFLLLNALGGAAVLGSYALGLRDNPALAERLWGSMDEGWKRIFKLTMSGAAIGYFPMTWFVARHLPRGLRVGSMPLPWVFFVAYALVLLPSALWLPLTVRHFADPSHLRWLCVRLDLFAVGLGSTALVTMLYAVRAAVKAPIAYRFAVAGAVAFWLQTAVFDAMIWPSFMT